QVICRVADRTQARPYQTGLLTYPRCPAVDLAASGLRDHAREALFPKHTGGDGVRRHCGMLAECIAGSKAGSLIETDRRCLTHTCFQHEKTKSGGALRPRSA